MPNSSNSRVFISYSRKDGLEFARALQSHLEAEGLSLYRDLSDLEGDQDWWRQVEVAIRSVEHVVLVITPQALQSRYVRDEWKLARQEGRSVWLVSGKYDLDFSHLPPWMERANRHDIDIQESLNRLILGLRAPSREKRVPFMADPLPAGFVERPEELADIKRRLLDAHGASTAISAGLRGAGGFGKTVLANALCHDPDIEEAFSDGILRVVLGERPDDLVGRIADLVFVLTGERPDVTHLEAAKSRLAEALDDRRCLLVIDDAWRAQDLAPFLHRGPKDHTTRLITTRDDRVLPSDVVRIPVDAMTAGQAAQMLERGLPDGSLSALRSRIADLAIRLGEWPLLLGLANGLLLARMRQRSSLDDAVRYVEQALARRGVGSIGNQSERRSLALGSLELSLEQLRDEERSRYAELAVFAEDADIPFDTALGLWHQTSGLDPFDGEELLTKLEELSLLSDLDIGRRSFRLHDVFRSLLRSGVAKDRLAHLDAKLIAHFRSICPTGNLACLEDRYGLRHAIVHLRGMGDEETADGLLLDPAWMQTKLLALGVQPLLADYEGTGAAALIVVAATLRLTANVLSRRPHELPVQLLALLSSEDAPGLKELRAKATAFINSHALVPLRPTFKPPGAELRRFEGHEEDVACVAALGDGRRAISGSDDHTLRLWDLETGAELQRFRGHEGHVTCVAVLADGRRAISGSKDCTLRLWNLETGAELQRFEGHDRWVTCVAVLAGGRAISGSADRTLRLWNLETGAELRRFDGHEGWVSCVAVLADGQRAVSGSDDHTVRIWDLEASAGLRRFEGHEAGVISVAVLADGLRAISGSKDDSLRLWDIETGAELRHFQGHESWVTSVAVLADGLRAISGSLDRTLRLWDLETGSLLRRFEGHESWVTCVAVQADGLRAISASGDCTLRLWDLGYIGAEPRRFQRHDVTVTSVAVLADGLRAISGSMDRTVRLWDLETGAELRRVAGHQRLVTSVAALPDGKRALSGSVDRTMRLWDLETSAELRRFEGHDDWVTCVAVLADGKRAISGSYQTLWLWDLATGADLRRIAAHETSISCVAALADGRRAISGSRDRTLRLWNLETGALLRRFEGHEKDVTCVAVLADGRRAISGSTDRTLRLWNLGTGALLRRFEGHDKDVTCLAITADGRRAISGSEDRTLRLWDLEMGAEITRITLDCVPRAVFWTAHLCSAVIGDTRGAIHVIKVVG